MVKLHWLRSLLLFQLFISLVWHFQILELIFHKPIWPENPSFGAFNYLFEETNFTRWYWNTLKIALINMFVGTILITGAAYVFARFSFKGKKAGLLTILVLQAFPSFMGLIMMYVYFGS